MNLHAYLHDSQTRKLMIIEVLLEVFYCCMFEITLGAQMYEFDSSLQSEYVGYLVSL